MIKLYGPAISQDATGKLADALIFSKSKKRAYAKAHANPAQPRTPKQLSVRTMTTWLNNWWRTLTTAQQATWQDRAESYHLPRYHAFHKANKLRWTNYLAPSNVDPPTSTPTIPSLPSDGFTAGVKCAIARIRYGGPPTTEAFIIFRVTGPADPPTQQNAIHILTAPPPGIWVTWRDTPLATGTYWYWVRSISADGGMSGTTFARRVDVL